MEARETIDYALEAARKAGADKAQAFLSLSEKSELNVDAGKMSLFRTTGNASLALTLFVGGRKGSMTLNKVDRASIDEAAAEAVGFARASEVDPANDISPKAGPKDSGYGDVEPDRGAMYDRMREFLSWASAAHPITKLEQCILDFTRDELYFGNSNGAAFSQRTGLYGFSAMFTSKDGEKTSSFNYSGAEKRALSTPLKDWGSVAELLRQSEEQVETRKLEGKFEGDIVMTPDCMGDLVYSLWNVYLGGGAMIAGTSPWKDKLGERVGSERFTLRSLPTSDRIAKGYFFTGDGFEAQDATIIEKGVLKSYLLNLYAANKTGKPRSVTGGDAFVVDPGEDSLASMIAGIDRGLLLCRFSGGAPSDNGDFSGVAKNSYLIEDGKIAGPVSETMVSGNFGRLIGDVKGVSRETVDFGAMVFPWMRFGGVTISGK